MPWVPARLIVVGHQSFLKTHRAVGLVGDQQDAIRNREGSRAECFVVQDAQGEPV
jgi:hypothetical protein